MSFIRLSYCLTIVDFDCDLEVVSSFCSRVAGTELRFDAVTLCRDWVCFIAVTLKKSQHGKAKHRQNPEDKYFSDGHYAVICLMTRLNVERNFTFLWLVVVVLSFGLSKRYFLSLIS